MEGERSFDFGPPNQHTEDEVDYAQTPPAGGAHGPIWQNCGFYSKPVRNENPVHFMEHEAVWVTYRPDLPAKQGGKLRELAISNTYVIVSPYPDLPSSVGASGLGQAVAPRFGARRPPEAARQRLPARTAGAGA